LSPVMTAAFDLVLESDMACWAMNRAVGVAMA
jgi:hypothetical protein